jgi:isoquinoline 1-oxidoreductase beta subunit
MEDAAMTQQSTIGTSERATRALTRRRFIIAAAAAGGGLAIGFRIPGAAALPGIAAQPWTMTPDAAAKEVNAWIVIAADDAVTIRIAKSEMGQGSLTALAMIVADELECDWTKVHAEYASANRNLREGKVYKEMSTGGSRAIRGSRVYLQQAGASARERLIAAAAARWGVARSECRAENGLITHAASKRSINFGGVAGEAATVQLAVEPAIKTPDKYRLIGQPTQRLDSKPKINGSAIFGMDVRLPGMLYAAVASCPVFGGTVKSHDFAAIKDMPGVHSVVAVPHGLAVVADSFYRAKTALAQLPIEWDAGPAGATSSEQFRKELRAALAAPSAALAHKTGDAAGAMPKVAKTVEALYEFPHLAHATMEPMNCTAHVQPDRVDVWLGTQSPENALVIAAEVSGVKPANVEIHNCYLGGGFGRRSYGDDVRQAVSVGKQLGRPVKLVWTREEDIQHDYYRPQAAIRFQAGLGADGMPVAWINRTAVNSISYSVGRSLPASGIESSAVEGLANMPYAVPNRLVECVLKNTHVPVGYWRSVGSSQNAMAVESFIDELAHEAGNDPYQFRRALLAGKPDFLKVLDTVAERGDWGEKLPKGKGRGIAIHEAFGSIVAEIAEISISQKGELRVERVVCAVDSGHVVNPRTVEMQMESGIVFGLTAALYGEITLKDGRVEQSNFDTYQILRQAEMPVIETHLALTGGDKWGGIGEPGTPPIAPAVCNAIFAVTGKRIRALPIKNHDLSWA